ncbi:hypothetical protein [Streptomyces curacoi]|uniref:Uncharacterized protein n=1 Tax=Streptomyces curacoi TaxID=146536 RepID=A0A117NTQ6_9ACTN|nr:hypothetical protein [Streptomyces curacoi]KUM67225.1 hypothetical protein AQI70_36420 [Streptomyces curacoi]
MDLAYKAIADDTVRIKARGDQDEVAADPLAAQAAELEWQINMRLGLAIGKLPDPPAGSH